MNRLLNILCFFLFAVLVCMGSARADLVFWDNDSNDFDFTNPVNWLGDSYPLAADYAVIQNNSYATVASAADEIARMYVGGDQSGSLDPALPMGSGTLNVVTGGSLLLSSSLYVAEGAGNQGTINLTGGTLWSGSLALANGVGSTGTFNVDGGDYVGSVYLYSGHAEGSRGTINLSSGTITLDNGGGTDRHVRIGNATDSVGTFHQTGGSLTIEANGALYAGMATGAYGYYELANGEFSGGGISPGAAAGGVGVVEQSAGTVMNLAAYGIRVGSSAGGNGLFNQMGGTVNCERVLWAGGKSANARGQIEVGGTISVVSNEYTAVSGYVGGSVKGYLNLNAGGTLTTPVVWTAANTAEGGEAFFNFHGGTLKANASTPDPADPATHYLRMPVASGGAFIGVEGGTIDTDGNDIVISDPLQALSGWGVSGVEITGGSDYAGPPIVEISGGSGWGATAVATVSGGQLAGITITNPGTGYASDDVLTATLSGGGALTDASVVSVTLAPNTLDGGLMKEGLGMLTLAGENSYTGLTDVQAGALSVTGSLAGSVIVDTDATLMGTGAIAGDVHAALGSRVAPGTSIGALTVSGNAVLAGVWDVEYDGTDPETNPIDLLTVSGVLNIDGVTIDLIDLSDPAGQPLAGPAYVFATYGTLAGSPAAVNNVPTGYHVEYAYGGNSIALVVPEPTTLVLLLGLLVGALAVRRRR